ncbi:hypothetical protein FB451DRAFT_1185342 [Mycena latifolia]|nr:hypothetical protein FB451DRAFT_1185342 [Mycena latifolia]
MEDIPTPTAVVDNLRDLDDVNRLLWHPAIYLVEFLIVGYLCLFVVGHAGITCYNAVENSKWWRDWWRAYTGDTGLGDSEEGQVTLAWTKTFVMTAIVLRLLLLAGGAQVQTNPQMSESMVWVANGALHGSTALGIIAAVWSVHLLWSAAMKGRTRAAALASAGLKDRTLDHKKLQDEVERGTTMGLLETGMSGPDPTSSLRKPTSTAAKIWVFFNTSLSLYEFYRRGVVSWETPLLGNVAAAVLFILHGVAGTIVVAVVLWLLASMVMHGGLGACSGLGEACGRIAKPEEDTLQGPGERLGGANTHVSAAGLLAARTRRRPVKEVSNAISSKLSRHTKILPNNASHRRHLEDHTALDVHWRPPVVPLSISGHRQMLAGGVDHVDLHLRRVAGGLCAFRVTMKSKRVLQMKYCGVWEGGPSARSAARWRAAAGGTRSLRVPLRMSLIWIPYFTSGSAVNRCTAAQSGKPSPDAGWAMSWAGTHGSTNAFPIDDWALRVCRRKKDSGARAKQSRFRRNVNAQGAEFPLLHVPREPPVKERMPDREAARFVASYIANLLSSPSSVLLNSKPASPARE